MRTVVVVKFEMEGVHHWPDAINVAPEVGHLSNDHMHRFHFRAEVGVDNNDADRQVEIIMLQREMKKYLETNFYDDTWNCLQFGAMSCEQIAMDLLDAFDCSMVEVLEDGNWGAKVMKDD